MSEKITLEQAAAFAQRDIEQTRRSIRKMIESAREVGALDEGVSEEVQIARVLYLINSRFEGPAIRVMTAVAVWELAHRGASL